VHDTFLKQAEHTQHAAMGSTFEAPSGSSGALMRHPDRRLPNAPLHSLPHITKICHESNIKLPGLFQLYQKYGAIAAGGGPCETDGGSPDTKADEHDSTRWGRSRHEENILFVSPAALISPLVAGEVWPGGKRASALSGFGGWATIGRRRARRKH
jgi:hypothetical protein